MGNWMNIGPRQPRGLTPCSRYMRIVSCEMRCRSSLYRSCIALSFGCREVIALICLLCLTVRGTSTALTRTVKPMMLKPKSLSRTLYRTSRLLIIGEMINVFQMSPANSNI